LPRTSDEAGGRNIVVDRTPLKLKVGFTPHDDRIGNSFVSEAIGSKNEDFTFGSIEQTVDMTRSRSVEFLIGQPEVKDDYKVSWYSRHGSAYFEVEKQRIDMAAVPKAKELEVGAGDWSWNSVRKKYYWAGWSWSWWLEWYERKILLGWNWSWPPNGVNTRSTAAKRKRS